MVLDAFAADASNPDDSHQLLEPFKVFVALSLSDEMRKWRSFAF
jgi:hypothetical protein